MKCINCGKRLVSGTRFCSDCGVCQENIEIINVKESKKSNKAFVLIIIGLLIISTGISVAIIAFNSNKDNKKENIEIVIDDDKEILFKNYLLKIPDGFKNYNSKLSNYIKNDYYFIFYEEYPLGYKDIINNKELLINELQNQDYLDIELNTKTINEENYIIVKCKLDNVDYGMIFYELDSDTNIFLTITANNLSKFRDEWFDETINFLNTKEKI